MKKVKYIYYRKVVSDLFNKENGSTVKAIASGELIMLYVFKNIYNYFWWNYVFGKKKLNTVPDVDFPDSILTIYEMYNVKKWLNFASN